MILLNQPAQPVPAILLIFESTPSRRVRLLREGEAAVNDVDKPAVVMAGIDRPVTKRKLQAVYDEAFETCATSGSEIVLMGFVNLGAMFPPYRAKGAKVMVDGRKKKSVSAALKEFKF